MTESGSEPAPPPPGVEPTPLAATETDPHLPARPGNKAFPPEYFEEYRLIRLLGRGGMGHVHLAYDNDLKRYVAIKFITRPNEQRRQRFLTEARAAARIHHPNVVTVYRIGEYQARPYIVSEYIRGTSLDALPRPMEWQRVAKLGLDVARGLAATHTRGILHRDIKPANAILSEDGVVKLVDFGLAKLSGADDGPQEVASPGNAPADSELIEASLIAGTPHYMAPELWHGHPATTRSDVYSLGVLLYFLCTDTVPYGGALRAELPQVSSTQDAPPVHERAPAVDERLAYIIDRCLRRDPAERFGSASDVRDRLQLLIEPDVAPALPEGNPYRGLLPFTAEQRALFFGRERDISNVIELLRFSPVVLIAGESGVGKSSVVRAGILPRVGAGALGEGRAWSHDTLVPGTHPFAALIAAIARFCGMDEAELARRCDDDASAPKRALRAHCGNEKGLVLFIDHLEEMVTVGDGPDVERAGELLKQLAEASPGIRLIATVRGDYVAAIAGIPGIGAHVEAALYILRPLAADAIHEVIVAPARKKGVEFASPDTVDVLVQATVGTEGGLPLLQFALSELWNTRDRRRQTIPEDALERIGGVSGALSRHADRVMAEMLPATRQAAQRILMRLVTHRHVLQRQRAEALGAVADAARSRALKALVAGRLVVAGESGGEPVYEIAHEALITGWASLRQWLDAERGIHEIKERLARASEDWRDMDCAPESLWSGRRLDEAARLDESELAPAERDFLAASRRMVARRTWVRLIAVISLLLLVGGIYLGYQLLRYRETQERQRALAQWIAKRHEEAKETLRQARSKREETEALKQQTLGKSTGGGRIAEAGAWVDTWRQTLRSLGETLELYRQASAPLEAVLQQTPGHAHTRHELAALIYERLQFAEEHELHEVRSGLAAQLDFYGGSYEAQWDAPIALTITTDRPATISIRQYMPLPQGTLQPKEFHAPQEREEMQGGLVALPPGSYRLDIDAGSDYVPIRYPILLRRGDPHRRIAVAIPRRDVIPPGFVYVPPGSFLFGFGTTRDDEPLRDWFITVPIHQRSTEAYLIGRHEVTYADWIAFLHALPAEQRDAYVPKVGEQHGDGPYLALLMRPDGRWELHLRPTSVEYRAAQGEPIEYLGRQTGIKQAWEQMPVTGISRAQAQAYLDWLAQSGMVPGASLCTEEQWERAARGADSRIFPHGNVLLPGEANYDETYTRGGDERAFGPDMVASYDASQSPFGVYDMAGNADEMTLSLASDERPVVRGGAFYHSMYSLASMNRQVVGERQRDLLIGFRVCAPAP